MTAENQHVYRPHADGTDACECGRPMFDEAHIHRASNLEVCPRCHGAGVNYSSAYLHGSAPCLLCKGVGTYIPKAPATPTLSSESPALLDRAQRALEDRLILRGTLTSFEHKLLADLRERPAAETKATPTDAQIDEFVDGLMHLFCVGDMVKTPHTMSELAREMMRNWLAGFQLKTTSPRSIPVPDETLDRRKP